MGKRREDGFEPWYRGQHPRLVTAVVLVCGDVHEAAEIADEAFARALARWDRVSRMGSPSGWTYRVAMNLVRRRARRRALERRLLARPSPSPSVPPPALEAWDAVHRLPPRQREAVILRYVGDLTEQEIARVMGVRRSTVSSALADAHRNLRRIYGEEAPFVERGTSAGPEVGSGGHRCPTETSER